MFKSFIYLFIYNYNFVISGRNLTYFVVAGTLGGLFTGIFKIAAQRELVQKQYMHDERVIKVSTHYPEMFVAYEVRKDRLAAKQKLRELAESH